MEEIVDDEFWLQRARKFITESDELATKSAENLLTFINWALTLYTASSIFTIEYNGIPWYWSILFALPFGLLSWSYVVTLDITLPKMINLDSRVPYFIKERHDDVIEYKAKQIRKARLITTGSVMSIAVLLIASFVLKNELANSKTSETFNVANRNVDKTYNIISIYVHLPGKDKIDLSIEPVGDTTGLARPLKDVLSIWEDGRLNRSYYVNAAEKYRVSISYDVEDSGNITVKTLAKTITFAMETK